MGFPLQLILNAAYTIIMSNPWQNRIIGYEDRDPKELKVNPLNWRKHPKAQSKALGGVIEEVGLVQNIILFLDQEQPWLQLSSLVGYAMAWRLSLAMQLLHLRECQRWDRDPG